MKSVEFLAVFTTALSIFFAYLYFRERKICRTSALAGLPNKVCFEEKRNRMKSVTAVAYIDIDGFKHINDSYGHAVGDRLISYIGKFLKEHTRKTDLPFHLSGDEFLIVFRNIKKEDVTKVMLQLMEGLSEKKFEVNGTIFKVEGTWGVEYVSEEIVDLERLVDAADHKMQFHKKKKGAAR